MNELPPPGWYPDVHAPGHERWWDGRAWSPATRPALAVQPAPAAAQYAPAGQYAQPGQYPQPGQYAPAGQYAQPGQYTQPGQYAPVYGKPPPVTPDGARLASWGRRAVARILDNLVVWVIVVVVGRGQLADLWRIFADEMRAAVEAAEAGVTYNSFELMTNSAYLEASLKLSLIFVLVSAIYDIPFVATIGATPGKLALGLRIRPWDRAGAPTWPASALRWSVWGLVPTLLVFFGGLFWWVDMLFPLWDPRRQALHDKAAKTVVVRT